MGSGHDFDSGRQVAAWIGLVPGQYSSGGKARLGRITKAGDSYLRSLLVMGARAVLNSIGDKQDRFSRWARSLQERRGYWRAVIAIAAKKRAAGVGGAEVRRRFQIGAGQGLKTKTVCQRKNSKGIYAPPGGDKESPMHCQR